VGAAAECQRCAAELSRGASRGQDLRERGEAERAALPALASGAAPALEPGAPLCLLPRAWLAAWRAFLAAAARRGGGGGAAAAAGAAADLRPPPPPDAALAELMCGCHAGPRARLGFRPPAVVRRCAPPRPRARVGVAPRGAPDGRGARAGAGAGCRRRRTGAAHGRPRRRRTGARCCTCTA